MAKRYRYSFAKQSPPPNAILAVALAALSFLLFFAAVAVSYGTRQKAGPLVGGICVFAALSALYGFLLGLCSFSKKDGGHAASVAGTIANGVILIGWLGVYLMGV